MKTKMDYAHEYAMRNSIHEDKFNTIKGFVKQAWEYADAMQAEADKRKKQKLDEVRKGLKEGWFLEKEGHHSEDEATLCNTYTSPKEWQPDWSQAPEWAEYWVKTISGEYLWCVEKPTMLGEYFRSLGGSSPAPSFNYQGNWQDSLRKRPEGK